MARAKGPWRRGDLATWRNKRVSLGKRFIDESFGILDVIYEEIARAIFRQPGGKAYLIYDSKIEDVRNYRNAIR